MHIYFRCALFVYTPWSIYNFDCCIVWLLVACYFGFGWGIIACLGEPEFTKRLALIPYSLLQATFSRETLGGVGR